MHYEAIVKSNFKQIRVIELSSYFTITGDNLQTNTTTIYISKIHLFLNTNYQNPWI